MVVLLIYSEFDLFVGRMPLDYVDYSSPRLGVGDPQTVGGLFMTGRGRYEIIPDEQCPAAYEPKGASYP